MKHKFFYIWKKYLIIAALLFPILMVLWFFYIYELLRFSTPSMAIMAQNIKPFSNAIAFNYSKNINKQIALFSKNIGLSKNNNSEFQLQNTGANGFIIFDLRPQFSKILFNKLDITLNDALQFIEETSLNQSYKEKSSFIENPTIHSKLNKLIANETENFESESPFTTPLENLIEEIINGQTFLIGGSTQFHFSSKDAFSLALNPYIKNFIPQKINFFRDMIIKSTPVYFQDFLAQHSINLDIEPIITNFDESIHKSQIIISIDDYTEFIDSFCSIKINPWDFCGRFAINRNKFRKNVIPFFGILSKNFKITANIFWKTQGKNIIYSNQEEFVQELSNKKNSIKNSNILTDVAASGDDFLFVNKNNLKYTSFSVYSDMIKTQNELIHFFELLRHNSQVMSDYFSSPSGSSSFLNIENFINNSTQFSQKSSLAFRTDGEILFPELRLYSPSNDLFIENKTKISPEFLNSIQVFVTKAISFGQFLSPKGLVPLPGPFIFRNGRWVILNSNINVKSMAPYLEALDPYIDQYDNPSHF